MISEITLFISCFNSVKLSVIQYTSVDNDFLGIRKQTILKKKCMWKPQYKQTLSLHLELCVAY